MDELSRQEKLVEQYAAADDKESAVKLLYALIVKCAEAKDFARAEALREKLFEVDAMALDAIVKAAELIEAGKSAARDQTHLNTWSKLYEKLTEGETNAFYFALQAATYEADQIIFRQGQSHSRLYFIDDGRLKMFFRKGKQGIMLKALGPGEIAGEETFFSNSFCTASLMTHSRVKLRFLGKEVLSKWKTEFPGLESKLHDYCLQLESVSDLLQKKGLERRAHERLNIPGHAAVQILKDSGEPAGKPWKAEVADISLSGLSFFYKIPAKYGTVLLGRRLNLKCILPQDKPKLKFERNATIVSVNSLPFEEFSIHVKFENELDPDRFKELANFALTQ
ncbi:MAG: cyclic nucleotide-binding domain-containing protein [Desulfobacterales bacterium]|nr:MAG: cyclic nucleotide-binding domain-containing protein [Desulfobacterales bacterium]